MKAARNSTIVKLHVEDGLNLTEISERYGISRERVRQIVTAAGQRTLTGERIREQGARTRAERAAQVEARRAERAARPFPHGTRAGYVRGCPCNDCREANRAYQASLKGRTPPSHGLSGYQNYACRCKVCKRAGAENNAHKDHLRRLRNA